MINLDRIMAVLGGHGKADWVKAADDELTRQGENMPGMAERTAGIYVSSGAAEAAEAERKRCGFVLVTDRSRVRELVDGVAARGLTSSVVTFVSDGGEDTGFSIVVALGDDGKVDHAMSQASKCSRAGFDARMASFAIDVGATHEAPAGSSPIRPAIKPVATSGWFEDHPDGEVDVDGEPVQMMNHKGLLLVIITNAIEDGPESRAYKCLKNLARIARQNGYSQVRFDRLHSAVRKRREQPPQRMVELVENLSGYLSPDTVFGSVQE